MSDLTVSLATPRLQLTDGRGTVTVSVTSSAPATRRIVLEVYAAPGTAAAPTDTVDPPVQEIGTGATAQYTVTLAAGTAPAGAYSFRAVAYPADRAPEEYADQGQTLQVEVPAAPEPVKRRTIPWWVWVVGGVVVLLAIGAVVLALTRHQNVAVPNVVGKPPAAAQQALTTAGLTGAVHETFGPAPLGVVLDQTPKAGTSVRTGSQVDLAVHTGFTVPDVAGKTVAQATAALAAGKLAVTQQTQQSDSAPGTVLGTNPAAGTVVGQGAALTLVVASPRLVTVPSLIGLQARDAVSQLNGLGLQLTLTNGPQCQTFLVCIVIIQNPPAGTQVPVGTLVQFSTS